MQHFAILAFIELFSNYYQRIQNYYQSIDQVSLLAFA